MDRSSINRDLSSAFETASKRFHGSDNSDEARDWATIMVMLADKIRDESKS